MPDLLMLKQDKERSNGNLRQKIYNITIITEMHLAFLKECLKVKVFQGIECNVLRDDQIR